MSNKKKRRPGRCETAIFFFSSNSRAEVLQLSRRLSYRLFARACQGNL